MLKIDRPSSISVLSLTMTNAMWCCVIATDVMTNNLQSAPKRVDTPYPLPNVVSMRRSSYGFLRIFPTLKRGRGVTVVLWLLKCLNSFGAADCRCSVLVLISCSDRVGNYGQAVAWLQTVFGDQTTAVASAARGRSCPSCSGQTKPHVSLRPFQLRPASERQHGHRHCTLFYWW